MKINCPHCQEEYDVEASDIGTAATCGGCQKDFTIKSKLSIRSSENPPPSQETRGPSGPVRNPASLTQSDRNVMERGRRAGRSLRVLAYLGTVVSAIAFFAASNAPKDNHAFKLFVLPISVITIGYWILSMEAKRGNPLAPFLGLIILSLQLVASVINAGFLLSQGKPQIPIIPIFIGALVIYSLHKDHQALKELSERNLRDLTFPDTPSSQFTCAIGGLTLFSGFLWLYTGLFTTVMTAGKAAQEKQQQVQAFATIINQDEKQFMDYWTHLPQPSTTQNLDEAVKKLTAIDAKVAELQKSATATQQKPLADMLQNYRLALQQWRKGIEMMKVSEALRPTAVQLMAEGDARRQQVLDSYNMTYSLERR